MMMYEFKNGMFQGWSPYFDQNRMDLSLQLPLPNNKKYIAGTVKRTSSFDLSTIIEDSLSLPLKVKVDILTRLKDSNILELYHPNKQLLDKVVKMVNTHNAYKNESGIKNFIVENLIKSSTHPRNQVASYTPISFGDYTEIGKKASSGAALLSNYDGFTTFSQQEQNAVGKDVIGVAATGLKVYFSLVTYFSDYYNGKVNYTDNKFFLRQFNLGGKQFIASKIGGLNLKEESEKILKSQVSKLLLTATYKKKDGTLYTQSELDALTNVLFDEDPGLKISALLSLATDNAKELILAKINAGLDFAGMHIYMLILGVDEKTSAGFMTSPEAMEIKRRMTSDFFISRDGSTANMVKNAIESYTKELNGEVSSIQNEIKEIVEANEGKKISKENQERLDLLKNKLNDVNQYNDGKFKVIEEFARIFEYSKEITALGRFESVNQGSKAKQEDIYSLVNRFNGTLISQQKSFFTKDFKELSKLGTIDEKLKLIPNLANIVIKDKPYLNIVHVNKVLNNAIVLGITDSLNLDLYYNDETYKQSVVDYYNLIKYTFNIFDVINSIPHYNSMLKAFYEGEKVIKQNVNAYAFISNTLPTLLDVARDNSELTARKIIAKTRFNQSIDLSVTINKSIMPTINSTYYKLLIHD